MGESGRFISKYGYFSEDGMEYVLTRPDPPRPWFNYFGHETYAVRFSQTGGDAGELQNTGGNRIFRRTNLNSAAVF